MRMVVPLILLLDMECSATRSLRGRRTESNRPLVISISVLALLPQVAGLRRNATRSLRGRFYLLGYPHMIVFISPRNQFAKELKLEVR